MVYKNELLLKLIKMGIGGHIYDFINSFLTNRTFQVRVSASLSNLKTLENGLPQGSVLSPLLIAVFINDLPNSFHSPAALFTDDLCYW